MLLEPLPIGLVYANPNQPRTVFEPGALAELAESIRELGLMQPISVRPDGKGRYIIVAGERRYRAHLLNGAETIRALVEDMPDEDLADRALVENLQRKDLSPLEEARAFGRRLAQGISPEDLARRLGVKQVWRITDRVALLRLEPEYQDSLAILRKVNPLRASVLRDPSALARARDATARGPRAPPALRSHETHRRRTRRSPIGGGHGQPRFRADRARDRGPRGAIGGGLESRRQTGLGNAPSKRQATGQGCLRKKARLPRREDGHADCE